MKDKIDALLSLRKEIENEIGESFFFPELGSCKGWLGTDPILFVSLNPSTGTFPSKADRFYYSVLEEFGFSNVHLTDLFKRRMTNQEFQRSQYQEVPGKNIEWLNSEIEILGSDVKLVAVGRKTRSFLEKVFDDQWLCPGFLVHYSYAVRFRKENEFRESLKDVKRWIQKK